jgi:hypothetical protein
MTCRPRQTLRHLEFPKQSIWRSEGCWATPQSTRRAAESAVLRFDAPLFDTPDSTTSVLTQALVTPAEEAVQISRFDDRADCRGEDQGRSRPKLVQVQGLRQPDSRGGFGAPSLRLQEAELYGATCSTLEDRIRGPSLVVAVRLPDVEHTIIEVDVVPTEGEQFAFP